MIVVPGMYQKEIECAAARSLNLKNYPLHIMVKYCKNNIRSPATPYENAVCCVVQCK